MTEEDYLLDINRGNRLVFDYEISNGDDTNYIFKDDDIVTFSIYEAFGLEKEPVLSKSFKPTSGSDTIKIDIPKDEMKFSEMTNTYVDYWYEITLNEETTLGFDDLGAKIIRIYPEGKAPENE